MTDFDPYRDWLQIHDPQRPVNHYQLLGIALFEHDPQVVADASDRRMLLLKRYQTGARGKQTQQLLNEIAAAKVCLLNPEKRTAHDQEIRDRLNIAGQSEPTAEPPPAAGDEQTSPLLDNITVRPGTIRSREKRAKRESRQMVTTLIGVIGGGLMAVIATGAVLFSTGFFSSSDPDTIVDDNDAVAKSDPKPKPNLEKPKGPRKIADPPKKPEGSREAWKNNASDVKFEKLDGLNWGEFKGPASKPRYRFVEKERNADYVELFDSSRVLSVRLYASKMWLKKKDASDWRIAARGSWSDVPKGTTDKLTEDVAETQKVRGRFWLVYSKCVRRIHAGDKIKIEGRSVTIDKVNSDSLVIDGKTMPFGTQVVNINLALAVVNKYCQDRRTTPLGNWFRSRDILNKQRQKIEVSIPNLALANSPRIKSLNNDPPTVGSHDSKVNKSRLAVPTDQDRKSAEKVIKEQYAAEIRDRDNGAKEQFASDLVATASETDEAAAKYCLLQLAIETAAEIGNVAIVFEATDAFIENFDVERWPAITDSFEKVTDKIKTPQSYHEFINLLPKYVKAAIKGEQFESAIELVDIASKIARKAKSKTHAQAFAKLSDNIKEMNEIFSDVEKARLTIKDGTEASPDSKLTIGRYLCFVQQDFARGLPMLTKGSDEKLAKVAANELKSKGDAKDVADQWIDMVGSLKKSEKFFGQQMKIHAAKIYRQELASKQGLERTQIRNKLFAIERETHQAWPVVFSEDPLAILKRYEWTVDWSKGADWKPLTITDFDFARIKIDGRERTSRDVLNSPAGVQIVSSDKKTYALVTLVGLELFATMHQIRDDSLVAIGHGGPTAERPDNTNRNRRTNSRTSQ